MALGVLYIGYVLALPMVDQGNDNSRTLERVQS